MRLVEEEDKLWLFRVPRLRQCFEELRKQVEHEGRVEPRVLHDPRRVQDSDESSPIAVRPKKIPDINGRFSKETISSRIFQCHHGAENRVQARLRHIAVFSGILCGILPDILEHGAEVLGVEEKKLLLIRNPEYDRKDIRLKIRELEKP